MVLRWGMCRYFDSNVFLDNSFELGGNVNFLLGVKGFIGNVRRFLVGFFLIK